MISERLQLLFNLSCVSCPLLFYALLPFEELDVFCDYVLFKILVFINSDLVKPCQLAESTLHITLSLLELLTVITIMLLDFLLQLFDCSLHISVIMLDGFH